MRLAVPVDVLRFRANPPPTALSGLDTPSREGYAVV